MLGLTLSDLYPHETWSFTFSKSLPGHGELGTRRFSLEGAWHAQSTVHVFLLQGRAMHTYGNSCVALSPTFELLLGRRPAWLLPQGRPSRGLADRAGSPGTAHPQAVAGLQERMGVFGSGLPESEAAH